VSILKRAVLHFADFKIELVDRDRSIQQVVEWAREGTWCPIVVFGPEGCGKTAWLKQTTEVLKEQGFDVIYIDPIHRDFIAYTDIKDVMKKLAEAAAEAIDVAGVKLATLAIDSVKDLLSRWRKRRIAVLVDDVFQAIGLDKAGIYVKSLLNLIEYPPQDYEKMVVIAATSEGVSRREIGRHRWAEIMPIWNMSRRGFEELYGKLPDPKPPVDEVWRLTGGNPYMLERLYKAKWSVNIIINRLIGEKEITPSFTNTWRNWLKKAVEDPDNLWSADTPEELVDRLIAKNLIVYNMYNRDPVFWIDQPPPEKDLELGIGKHVAWQTPLHREAARRCLTAEDRLQ